MYSNKIKYLILVLLMLLLYFESAQIYYFLNLMFQPSGNRSGVPTPFHIRQKIVNIIEGLPKREYIFIDFGCGDGDLIESVYTKVKSVVGIELDIDQASIAKKRFSSIPSIHISYMDMTNYIFPYKPHILYMYEPLWLMKKEEAYPIYDKVIKNMSSSTQPCYIIYVSGVKPILDEKIFIQHSFTLVYHTRIRRMLGWNANHLYLFQKNEPPVF